MKQIPLTHGFFALVDDEDYEELIKYKWHTIQRCGNIYARRNRPKALKPYMPNDIYMHRVILGIDGSSSPLADHIDRNGLNNQKSNLRIVNRRENNLNKRISKNNSSNFRGVSFHKRRNKFQSRIMVHGKMIHLGVYKTAEEAASVYKKAFETYNPNVVQPQFERVVTNGNV